MHPQGGSFGTLWTFRHCPYKVGTVTVINSLHGFLYLVFHVHMRFCISCHAYCTCCFTLFCHQVSATFLVEKAIFNKGNIANAIFICSLVPWTGHPSWILMVVYASYLHITPVLSGQRTLNVLLYQTRPNPWENLIDGPIGKWFQIAVISIHTIRF